MKSLVVLTLLPIAASESCDAIEKVNGFIGTGGLGFGYGGVNPGAQFPTAPLRLGPDTTYTVGNIGMRMKLSFLKLMLALFVLQDIAISLDTTTMMTRCGHSPTLIWLARE